MFTKIYGRFAQQAARHAFEKHRRHERYTKPITGRKKYQDAATKDGSTKEPSDPKEPKESVSKDADDSNG